MSVASFGMMFVGVKVEIQIQLEEVEIAPRGSRKHRVADQSWLGMAFLVWLFPSF
jgi:hypothetical protein